MAIYLAKMSMHHVAISALKPSILAIAAIYVSLKICEQLIKKDFINELIVKKMLKVSHSEEDEIIEVSQRVLALAQNFEGEFPGLVNLRNTHFTLIT